MTSPKEDVPTGGSDQVKNARALVANVEAMRRAALNEDWDHLTIELLPVLEMLAAQQVTIAVAADIAKSG